MSKAPLRKQTLKHARFDALPGAVYCAFVEILAVQVDLGDDRVLVHIESQLRTST